MMSCWPGLILNFPLSYTIYTSNYQFEAVMCQITGQQYCSVEKQYTKVYSTMKKEFIIIIKALNE